MSNEHETHDAESNKKADDNEESQNKFADVIIGSVLNRSINLSNTIEDLNANENLKEVTEITNENTIIYDDSIDPENKTIEQTETNANTELNQDLIIPSTILIDAIIDNKNGPTEATEHTEHLEDDLKNKNVIDHDLNEHEQIDEFENLEKSLQDESPTSPTVINSIGNEQTHLIPEHKNEEDLFSPNIPEDVQTSSNIIPEVNEFDQRKVIKIISTPDEDFNLSESLKSSINIVEDMMRVIETKPVHDSSFSLSQHQPYFNQQHNSSTNSLTTDSLSDKNFTAVEKELVKAVNSADKKFSKWYQAPSSTPKSSYSTPTSSRGKETNADLNKSKKNVSNSKINYPFVLAHKPPPAKSSLTASNCSLKSASSVYLNYLIRNMPINTNPTPSPSKHSCLKPSLRPSRNLPSISADSEHYEKIRIYRKKRWTSESPVKNYINGTSANTSHIKTRPVSVANEKQSPKQPSKPQTTYSARYEEMLQLRNRQSTKNNSLNSSKTSLNNSFYAQDSTSFLTKRSGLTSKAQYYGVDDKEESFQFLKSYLDYALMDKAYKTRIPIMQGSSLSSKIEAVGSSRPGRTTFYGTLKSLWKRVCVDNALYVYNMAMNRKEALQSNEKNVEYRKMMKSYEDAFRNMKETDLENKKVLKVAQLQGSDAGR
jgi:hypothetical protein